MPKRFNEIDGIRGWASLSVLVYHLSWELFGVIFPIYRTYYLKFFLDGQFAVAVFFVLSGDALSTSFVVGSDRRQLAKLVLKRYFRLAGPILISCAFVYFLLKYGFALHRVASKIVNRSDWLDAFLPFRPSLSDMFWYALLGVFTEHTFQVSYNPFLWPMSTELYGSFILFGILFSFEWLKRPSVIVSALVLYLWILGSFYALFFVGLGLAMLRADGFFDKIRRSRVAKYSFFGLLLVVVLEACFARIDSNPPRLSILLAAIFVFFIYINEKLISFFSNRLSRFLGRLSFPLYLCQFPIIISYSSLMIFYFKVTGVLDFPHSLLIIFSSALLVFFFAEVLSRIEKVYLKWLDSTAMKILQAP